jgi:hypothetical protein
MSNLRFPGDQERISIIGATGSGKTHAALWHLSKRNYDIKPWIIYDFKYDDLIGSIEGTQEITLAGPIPERPGIYVVHPGPGDEENVEAHMWQIWNHENIGVYIDEGYMVGNNNKAFRALLTQGRSKHIPMITLSQRPVWMDRFVFSESEFFQVFRLQHQGDIKKIGEYIPHDITRRLPLRNSYYYDATEDKLVILGQVPDRENLLSTFDSKLRKLKRVV